MMRAWHLGRLAGIDVRIHWTFLLVPLWVYFSSLAAGSGIASAALSVLFVLTIFACVLCHEYGHALMARYFGIPTRDITLLPIGGVASLQRMPRRPGQELAIALAGPAVNVGIAAVIFAGIVFLNPASGAVALFATQLAIVNVALVVFNMLPAFPMDGGRVLRSLLAMWMPYASATRIAATIGQITAMGFGLLGLITGNWILVLVAGFIFLAARGEAMMASKAAPSHELPFEQDSSSEVKARLMNHRGSYVPPRRSQPIVIMPIRFYNRNRSQHSA
ncbi:putative zinc metalloprotease Rip3 [Novipirellula galeiformis]|uniref:Putative zinc metalloprotease Rip3 n=1 Tax=Novipirellula galeiformis TaxID=2528004 RepID=A0A5C6C807_9BACT|nr:site-2 protease family protein [Novipirellula galeiformis]TWU20282.1 putative zinc metalloprotease Rip3 [Novipirellula galeiformis]